MSTTKRGQRSEIRGRTALALLLALCLPAGAQEPLHSFNVGAAANDRTGDSLRTAFLKAGSNFLSVSNWVGLLNSASNRLAEPDWDFVVIPDTQNDAASEAGLLTGMVQWLTNSAQANVRFVLHTGDYVNSDGNQTQWNYASNSFAILRAAGIDYLPSVGNHDESAGGNTDLNQYNLCHPASYFTGRVGYSLQNTSAAVMSFKWTNGPQPYLILNLPCYASTNQMAWCLAQASNAPNHRVILLTHAYLGVDDTRLVPPDQYAVGPSEGANGDDIWGYLASRLPNFIQVWSGHDSGSDDQGRARRVDNGLFGNPVHQFLINYQQYGTKELAHVKVRPSANRCDVYTYRPSTGAYLTTSREQFSFPLYSANSGNPVDVFRNLIVSAPTNLDNAFPGPTVTFRQTDTNTLTPTLWNLSAAGTALQVRRGTNEAPQSNSVVFTINIDGTISNATRRVGLSYTYSDESLVFYSHLEATNATELTLRWGADGTASWPAEMMVTNGIYNNAVYFTNHRARVTFPDNWSALNDLASMTALCWVKHESADATADIETALSKFNISGADGSFFLGFYQSKLYCRIVSDTGVQNNLLESSGSRDTNWHCYALVLRNATTLEVFQDGVLKLSGAFSGATMKNTTYGVMVGATTSPLYGENGIVDEPRIYSRPLTTNELLTIYYAGMRSNVGLPEQTAATNLWAERAILGSTNTGATVVYPSGGLDVGNSGTDPGAGSVSVSGTLSVNTLALGSLDVPTNLNVGTFTATNPATFRAGVAFAFVTAPVAPTATLIATNTGNLTEGTNAYKVTYITADGETELSAPSATNIVDATHKQVTITLPISTDSRVTGRGVYRTDYNIAGGITPYYLLTNISDNVTATWVDNLPETVLGTNTAALRPNNTSGRLSDGSTVIGFISKTNDVALGPLALATMATNGGVSGGNTIIGARSARSLRGGYLNSTLGFATLEDCLDCIFCIAIGDSALIHNQGNFNNALGWESQAYTTWGTGNNTFGYAAGRLLGYSSFSVAMGHNALSISTNGWNTALGSDALGNNVSGAYGAAVGFRALQSSLGHYNSAVGSDAGQATIGDHSAYLGFGAGMHDTNGYSFYVDSIDRSNVSGDRTSALLYGRFNGSPSAQTLTVNAKLGINTTNPITSFDVLGPNNVASAVIRSDTCRLDIAPWSDGTVYLEFANAANNASALGRFTGYQGSTGTFSFNGSVGIGTNSPQAALHVGNGGSAIIDGTATFGAGITNGAFSIKPVASTNLAIAGPTGTILTMNTNGNVGIGTTTPVSLLHVAGDVANVLTLQRSSDNAFGAIMEIRKSRGTAASPTAVSGGDSLFRLQAGGRLATDWSSSANDDAISVLATENWTDSASGKALYLWTVPNTTLVPLARMMINQNGNVGIGTTTPLAPLSVSNSAATLFQLSSPGVPAALTVSSNGTVSGAGLVLRHSANTNLTVAATEAGLYSTTNNNAAAKGELYAVDGNGTHTLISPHSDDAPDWLRDDADGLPDQIDREWNQFTGVTRWINRTRMAKLQAALIAGTDLSALPILQRRCIAISTNAARRVSWTNHYAQLQFNYLVGLTNDVRDWRAYSNSFQPTFTTTNATGQTVIVTNEWNPPAIRPLRNLIRTKPVWAL